MRFMSDEPTTRPKHKAIAPFVISQCVIDAGLQCVPPSCPMRVIVRHITLTHYVDKPAETNFPV
jgi:hypothetical protein